MHHSPRSTFVRMRTSARRHHPGAKALLQVYLDQGWELVRRDAPHADGTVEMLLGRPRRETNTAGYRNAAPALREAGTPTVAKLL